MAGYFDFDLKFKQNIYWNSVKQQSWMSDIISVEIECQTTLKSPFSVISVNEKSSNKPLNCYPAMVAEWFEQ